MNNNELQQVLSRSIQRLPKLQHIIKINYSWFNNTIITIYGKDGIQNQQRKGLEITKIVSHIEVNLRIKSSKVVELLARIHHMKFEPKRRTIDCLIVLPKSLSLQLFFTLSLSSFSLFFDVFFLCRTPLLQLLLFKAISQFFFWT